MKFRGSGSSSRTPNDLLHRVKVGGVRQSIERGGSGALSRLSHALLNNAEMDTLLAACAKGDLATVQHVLSTTRPPINLDLVRDSKMRSPMLIACASGNSDLVRMLIRYGASVTNVPGDIVGNQPLDLAVISNSMDTILTLLDAGKLKSAKNDLLSTRDTLHPPTHPAPKKKLGAQIRPSLPSSSKDERGTGSASHRAKRTPLDLAQSRLKLMNERGISKDTSSFVAQMIQIIQLLKHYMKTPVQEASMSNTPLDTLDDLASKLSSLDMDEGEHNKVVDGLAAIIDKFHIDSK
ncbi:hypothetical protein BC940DRAFT_20460 [Gongronella butleri]|nr:hypothetical protein BC940DRAFT_20460 [Gongronella butleri]